jgi:hypothetical protein
LVGKQKQIFLDKSMKPYSREFYINRNEKTVYSANTILSIVQERIPAIHSAIDVGCGIGTWLNVLKEKGVEEILGLDGTWVDQNLLVIPQSCFKSVDLSKSVISPPLRYDLAICLEVAEHLPSEHAKEFVSYLTDLSDYVLFSAAIPYQGGRNHINEQWQHYWVDLFAAKDYHVYDFIRQIIWNNNQIPSFYRQNIFLFSKHQISYEPQSNPTDGNWGLPIDVVHPDFYQKRPISHIGIRSSLQLVYLSIKEYLNKLLRIGSQ